VVGGLHSSSKDRTYQPAYKLFNVSALLGSIVWAVCTIQQETASRARTNISITRRARFPALRDLFVIGATRSMINNRLGGKDGDGWKRERNAGVLLVHTNFFDCFTEHFMRVAKCCMHRFLLLGWPFFHSARDRQATDDFAQCSSGSRFSACASKVINLVCLPKLGRIMPQEYGFDATRGEWCDVAENVGRNSSPPFSAQSC